AGMSRHAKRKSSKLKRPKTKLGLPDLDHSKSAVLDSLRSPESKRGYRHAIDEFIQWYCSEPRLSFNKIVVTRYRISSRIASSRQERSMDDSLQCGGSPTRLPTLACSVRSSPPASGGGKGPGSWVSGLEIGLPLTRPPNSGSGPPLTHSKASGTGQFSPSCLAAV